MPIEKVTNWSLPTILQILIAMQRYSFDLPHTRGLPFSLVYLMEVLIKLFEKYRASPFWGALTNFPLTINLTCCGRWLWSQGITGLAYLPRNELAQERNSFMITVMSQIELLHGLGSQRRLVWRKRMLLLLVAVLKSLLNQSFISILIIFLSFFYTQKHHSHWP